MTRWSLLAMWVLGCVETSWAQPRPRRDAGAADSTAGRARDAGTGRPRRDAGSGDEPTARPPDAGRGRRDAGATDGPTGPRPATHGTLPAAEVQRLLRAHQGAIRQCYESALAQDATLHGDLTVRARVEPDGRVSDTASSGDDALRPVGQCIGRVLRGVRFPAPTGGAATVVAPFVFAAGE